MDGENQNPNVSNDAPATSEPAPAAPEQPTAPAPQPAAPAPMDNKPMDSGKKGGKGLMWAVVIIAVLVVVYLVVGR